MPRKSASSQKRSTRHTLNAYLQYRISNEIETCKHCHKYQNQHADGSCLFESTTYDQQDVKKFFDQLLFHGGEITITAGKSSLRQKIGGSCVDHTVIAITGNWQTSGPADLTLEEETRAS